MFWRRLSQHHLTLYLLQLWTVLGLKKQDHRYSVIVICFTLTGIIIWDWPDLSWKKSNFHEIILFLIFHISHFQRTWKGSGNKITKTQPNKAQILHCCNKAGSMCYCSPHCEEQLKQIEEWRIPMLLKYQYKTGVDPQSTLEVEATLFRGTLSLWELTSVKVRNGCWKIWIIPLTKKYLRTAQALFDPFKGTLMAKIVAFRSVPQSQNPHSWAR